MRFVNGNATRSCHYTKPTSRKERLDLLSPSLSGELRAQNKSANKTGKQNKPQDRNETSEREKKSRDETMTSSSSAFPVAAKSFASFLFFSCDWKPKLKLGLKRATNISVVVSNSCALDVF